MLVINGDRTNIPGTERRVIGWLRNHDAPGLVISGCQIEDRRSQRTYEADLVVLTPETCAVVEVKGMLTEDSGTMKCPANGRWSMPGVPGDPVHVRTGDTSPLDQVTGRMYDLKHLVEEAGGQGLFVAGLVLVLPARGAEVTLDKGPMPTGRDVLVGPAGMMGWLRGTARRKESPWTAEVVLAVLQRLGVTAVTHAQLLAHGFPSHTPTAPPTSGRDVIDPFAPDYSFARRPPTSFPRPEPISMPTPPAQKPEPIDNPDLGRTDSYKPGEYAVPFPQLLAETSSRRSRARSAAIAAVVFAMIAGGIWAVTDIKDSEASDSPTPATTSLTEQPTTSAEQAPPPETEPVVVEAPPAAPAPAPVPSRGCFPFQPNC
ncbi:nuclease-related domain-containing protein [Nocardia sp. NPDC051832]|uniref:nuclease-related domain-containing protein n=1 Tax=Nocardia sp. NPDC051832 TaxID=3155673 RepID=UPI00341E7AD0